MPRFLNLACFPLLSILYLVGPTAIAENKFSKPLSPAPGIHAQIKEHAGDYVLIQPTGETLTLVYAEDRNEDTKLDFSEEDYDFDGFPDLAVGLHVGMVNVFNDFYLYNPEVNAYEAFSIPQDVYDRQSCPGFWHIERLPEQKALQSSCRDAAMWHYDILQIDADRTIWISEQTLLREYKNQWPYFEKPLRTVRYDRSGTILTETAIIFDPELGDDPSWVVPVPQLPLYSAPDKDALTKGYLIQDDVTQMLEFQGDEWMKIAFEGKNNRIERWLSLKDAYDLAKRYDPEQPPVAPMVLWALDYSESKEDPDFYRNLFTLFVDNTGTDPIPLHESEIHLVFSSSDGTRVAHKLYGLFNFVLKPGESRILDDNPVEKHGERYVLFHHSGEEPEYVAFFPPDLEPGFYEVTPVLTNFNLPGPIYAQHSFRIQYPPKLAPALIKDAQAELVTDHGSPG